MEYNGYISPSGNNPWSNSNNIKEFCEFVLIAIGCNLTYDQFCNMSSDERKSLLRDMKIKKILE